MAASAPARAKVIITISSVLIPMSPAICRSSATARKARPRFVRVCSSSRPTTIRRAETTSSASGTVMATPEIFATFHPKMESASGGRRRASAPTVFLMRSMAMRPTPKVVRIQPTLVEGSNRPSGLMATISTRTPTASDATIDSANAPQIGTPARATAKAMYPATTSIEPWAKFTIRVDAKTRL